LMKSSIGASFSIDSSAPGGGPSWTVAADDGAETMTAAAIAAIAANRGRNNAGLHGNIDWPDRSSQTGETLLHRRGLIQMVPGDGTPVRNTD
jgi:hypothetical protein